MERFLHLNTVRHEIEGWMGGADFAGKLVTPKHANLPLKTLHSSFLV